MIAGSDDNFGKAHGGAQRVRFGRVLDRHGALRTVERDGAAVAILGDDLDPRDRAPAQEVQHRRPIVRRVIAQQQRDLAARPGRHVFGARAPQCARRAAEQRLKRLVEAADAAEAGGEGDLGHRQLGLVDELLGQQHAAGLRDGDRRGAEMLLEQPPQMALADAEPLGESIERRLVERAELDQRQRARHGVGGAAPGAEIGRGLGPAAQAGAEAGFLCRGGGRKEGHILFARRARRADRPAIDAGRLHAGEEPAVEARIALRDGAIAGIVIEIGWSISMPYKWGGERLRV